MAMKWGCSRRSRVVRNRSIKMLPEVQIVHADFDVAAEYQALCDAAPKSGAVVFFVGLVRDYYELDNDDSINFIELSHYPGMTESRCQRIIDQARKTFPFDAVRLVHRVGKIGASEQIVMVAVASRHRDNAFKAARFIMDYLKTRAPFWKKEVGSRGQQWVGMKDTDKEAAKGWQGKI